MPHLILKPQRDVDFYVDWSTITDTVVASGTRAELSAAMVTHRTLCAGSDPSRFDRADRTGSSADGAWVGYLGWDSPATLIASHPFDEQRLLPRENLRAFADALNADDVPAALALTSPIEDAGEADPALLLYLLGGIGLIMLGAGLLAAAMEVWS